MSAPDAFNAWLRRGLMIGVHVFWMMVVGVALIPAPKPADALCLRRTLDGNWQACIDRKVGNVWYEICYTFGSTSPTTERIEK